MHTEPPKRHNTHLPTRPAFDTRPQHTHATHKASHTHTTAERTRRRCCSTRLRIDDRDQDTHAICTPRVNQDTKWQIALAAHPTLTRTKRYARAERHMKRSLKRDHQCSATEAHRIERTPSPNTQTPQEKRTANTEKWINQSRRRHRKPIKRPRRRAVHVTEVTKPTRRLAPQGCCAQLNSAQRETIPSSSRLAHC